MKTATIPSKWLATNMRVEFWIAVCDQLAAQGIRANSATDAEVKAAVAAVDRLGIARVTSKVSERLRARFPGEQP